MHIFLITHRRPDLAILTTCLHDGMNGNLHDMTVTFLHAQKLELSLLAAKLLKQSLGAFTRAEECLHYIKKNQFSTVNCMFSQCSGKGYMEQFPMLGTLNIFQLVTVTETQQLFCELK